MGIHLQIEKEIFGFLLTGKVIEGLRLLHLNGLCLLDF